MDDVHVINIKRGLLWSVLVPVVIFVPSIIVGVFGVALGTYPTAAPFGFILSLFASAVTLFPWEFADMLLNTCDGSTPLCNTEEAVFQLTFLSLALSFAFYACAGFVLGLLRQCIALSTTRRNTVVFDITHRKIVFALGIVLCVLIVLLGWGNYLNLQKSL